MSNLQKVPSIYNTLLNLLGIKCELLFTTTGVTVIVVAAKTILPYVHLIKFSYNKPRPQRVHKPFPS